MTNTEKQLQNQVEYIKQLENKCQSQKEQIDVLETKVDWLLEQIRLSKHKQFGTSSEKTTPEQLAIFNEPEKEADESVKEPELEEINYKRKKRAGKKEEMLADLPVETINYYLDKEEQVCPECGEELHVMGKEIRKELKIIPPQVKVIEYIKHTYSCRKCEKYGYRTPIVKAAITEPVIKGSIASPSLVAYIMSQKYVNALPLYRQEQEFKRLGIDISRQTMANWIIRCANDWLEPLYLAMKELLRKQKFLHADETVLQVLKEPGKKPQSKSYMWLYRTSGEQKQPIILYEYQPDRSSKRPKEFLAGFKGYLHADGYDGYHSLPKDIIICGCLAHARRKFEEALKSIKPSEQIGSKALIGKNYCDKLFEIEKKLINHTPKEKYEKRLEQAKPVLDELQSWLKSLNPLANSALGKAVNYALNQWKYLINYMLDGSCELSNNRAERSIKPFIIGRKNFLFADTPRGAKASAIIYSIVETAKENGLNPLHYLTYLFEKMPNLDFKNNPNVIEQLFPWSTLPENCYVKKNG